MFLTKTQILECGWYQTRNQSLKSGWNKSVQTFTWPNQSSITFAWNPITGHSTIVKKLVPKNSSDKPVEILFKGIISSLETLKKVMCDFSFKIF
jgi:hypothetical protein